MRDSEGDQREIMGRSVGDQPEIRERSERETRGDQCGIRVRSVRDQWRSGRDQ